MSSSKESQELYPVHWLVWHNDIRLLSRMLNDGGALDLEKKDPRGRTPLMLAVTLGHLECSRELLKHNADANAENKGYWAVVHEATSTGDPELLKKVLHYRDYQRIVRTKEAMTRLLKKLKDTPDFYTELRWEFSSWLPFVSKMCPSDTYKVYKRGATVRVDTTLVGFDASNQWERGDISYLFRINDETPELLVIDHQRRCVICEQIPVPQSTGAMSNRNQGLDGEFQEFEPTQGDVSERVTSPIATTYVDVEKIGFERAKSGIPGWRSDRNEDVNGYECKVYTASNVELMTKTRKEHLTERDKSSQNDESNPLDSLLKFVQKTEVKREDPAVSTDVSLNPSGITPEEYFNPLVDLNGRDIGRPKDVTIRSNSFKANLWLCDNFPLSLQEQITPIIDLMAASNAHFARLKNFIELQLPAGFPVKIEIPLFHVISACITFGNVFAVNQSVANVSIVEQTAPDGSVQKICQFDDEIFAVPSAYPIIGSNSARRRPNGSGYHGYMGAQAEEDVLLQFAIQQSLLSSESSPNNEEITPNLADHQIDWQLQQAITRSLQLDQPQHDDGDQPAQPQQAESGLTQILEVSRREEEERQKRLVEQEEEDLKRILELSKTDM